MSPEATVFGQIMVVLPAKSDRRLCSYRHCLQAGIEWATVDSQLEIQKTVHEMYAALVEIISRQAATQQQALTSVLLFTLSTKYR